MCFQKLIETYFNKGTYLGKAMGQFRTRMKWARYFVFCSAIDQKCHGYDFCFATVLVLEFFSGWKVWKKIRILWVRFLRLLYYWVFFKVKILEKWSESYGWIFSATLLLLKIFLRSKFWKNDQNSCERFFCDRFVIKNFFCGSKCWWMIRITWQSFILWPLCF